jgi:hypothetical protein
MEAGQRRPGRQLVAWIARYDHLTADRLAQLIPVGHVINLDARSESSDTFSHF